VIASLSAALLATPWDPEVLAKLAAQGLEPLPSTPEEFQHFLRAEAARRAWLARVAGITAN
jgi:tripartite-type tricarboxylate transporter receptor subunit TctC